MSFPWKAGWLVSRETFEVAYDGQALRRGTMDVRQLAPALLAIGDVVEESNRVLNEGRASVSVHVKAGAEPGSFPIDLEVAFALSDQLSIAVDQIQTWDAEGLLKVIGLWGSAAGGLGTLISLVRKLQGKEPQDVKQVHDGSTLVEVNGDNNQIITGKTTPEAARLYQSRGVRGALGQAVRPLEEEGVDELQIRRNREVVDRVTKDDLPYFLPGRGDETVEENVQTLTVEVKRVVFDESNSFQFYDGDGVFYAKITDGQFWEDVHKGNTAFRDRDRMKVKVVSTQRVKEDGSLSKSHEVVRVIEHKHLPKQGDWVEDLDGDEGE